MVSTICLTFLEFLGKWQLLTQLRQTVQLINHSDNTQTLRDIGLSRGALATGRDSDIRPLGLADEDTENTFMFTVPPRDASEDPSEELLRTAHTSQLRLAEENAWGSERTDPLEADQADEGNEGEDEDDNEQSVVVSANGYTQLPYMDTAAQDATIQSIGMTGERTTTVLKKKKVKVSKHGIQYSSLPTGVVKKLATTFARAGDNNKTKISKETLDAIIQASDWFFEQVSDDLGAYAQHARRKAIDESDVITLMARCASFSQSFALYGLTVERQRQTNATTTPFSLAQRYLPRELLQEMRMVPPPQLKKEQKQRVRKG
jgi:histone H3/H4